MSSSLACAGRYRYQYLDQYLERILKFHLHMCTEGEVKLITSNGIVHRLHRYRPKCLFNDINVRHTGTTQIFKMAATPLLDCIENLFNWVKIRTVQITFELSCRENEYKKKIANNDTSITPVGWQKKNDAPVVSKQLQHACIVFVPRS